VGSGQLYEARLRFSCACGSFWQIQKIPSLQLIRAASTVSDAQAPCKLARQAPSSCISHPLLNSRVALYLLRCHFRLFPICETVEIPSRCPGCYAKRPPPTPSLLWRPRPRVAHADSSHTNQEPATVPFRFSLASGHYSVSLTRMTLKKSKPVHSCLFTKFEIVVPSH
jgi:hypothetical protein